ncbi:hypothetical protein C8A01DRAFT_44113 [Parachaetomium inaequale]|uniref:Uncharacterized protein n=1 Tax=Parachaetomium inaequale TaxID=2588326 RepID=A0AAN6PLF0_9PEZI|nr:hypothetical protein C8A01DRAFT_44113 [Parachaetomium inaequale]
MNVCPVPDPTSVAYLTGSHLLGSSLDQTAVCPAIPVCHGGPDLTIDFLRGVGAILAFLYRLIRRLGMDLELKDIARFIARSISYIAGTLAIMLKFLSAPVLWVLRACFWPIKAVFSAVFSLVYGILGIVVTPFLVPWYVTVWFWEVAVAVYDELEPLLIYFSFALAIGAVSGVLVVVLTIYIQNLLQYYIPFLRPRRRQRRRARDRHHTTHDDDDDRDREGRRHNTKSHHSHHSHHDHNTSKDKGKGKGRDKDRHPDSAVYWSSSPSPSSSSEEEEAFDHGFHYTLRPGGLTITAATRGSMPPSATASSSSSMAKSSTRRTPPAGVRVGDTIHEESSG